jgi:hypothetical protein
VLDRSERLWPEDGLTCKARVALDDGTEHPRRLFSSADTGDRSGISQLVSGIALDV